MFSALIESHNDGRFSVTWIANKSTDLCWFIGGSLAAYFMYYLHAGLNIDMVTIWFWWVVLLDTPHFFGTYLRTYLDKEEFQKRKKLLLLSLAWLIAGPFIFLIAYLMYKSGSPNYKFPFFAFLIVFNIWAYWHVVRQHYGIMSLYKRKNNDFSRIDNFIDKSLLYIGLLAPFTVFIFRHPDARELIGLDRQYITFSTLSKINSDHIVILIASTLIIIVSALFIGRLLFLF